MVKQVIVIRKDLNMRKGKMVAQGAHASLTAAWYAERWPGGADTYLEWWAGLQTKICVSVDSEAELFSIYQKAVAAGLPSAMVQDAGLTEFKEPTYTAVAIGPAASEQIDPITGSLKLL